MLSSLAMLLMVVGGYATTQAQTITTIELGDRVLIDLNEPDITNIFQVQLESNTALQVEILYLGDPFIFQLEVFAEDGSLLSVLNFDETVTSGTILATGGNTTLLFSNSANETGRVTLAINDAENAPAPVPDQTTPDTAPDIPFEDLANWTGFDNAIEPTLEADGSLCFLKDTEPLTGYFEPTLDFIQALELGTVIRFDLVLDALNDPYPDLDIQLLIGNGILLSFDLVPPPTTTPTTYEIPLTADAGWYDVDGVFDVSDPATFAQMVIDINTIRIRAEYTIGVSTACISNVQLVPANQNQGQGGQQGNAAPPNQNQGQGGQQGNAAPPNQNQGQGQGGQQGNAAPPNQNQGQGQGQGGQQGNAAPPNQNQGQGQGQGGQQGNAAPAEGDSDGDGILDANDNCPDEIGTEYGSGCPVDGADYDGDGILNDMDFCLYVVGVEEADGCPLVAEGQDTDQDGILDIDDVCPTNAGVENLLETAVNGCDPMGDEDGDGILNREDTCPLIVGVLNEEKTALNGCPADADFDADGIPDVDDVCPFTIGIEAAAGCLPGFDVDTDGDGVPDADDGCPQESGRFVPLEPAENGCPLPDEEPQEPEANEEPANEVPLALDGNPIQEGEWQIVNTAAGVGCENSEILGPPVDATPYLHNLRFSPEGIYWSGTGDDALFTRTSEDPIFRYSTTSEGIVINYILVFDSPTSGEYIFRVGPQGCDGVFIYAMTKVN